MNNAISHLSIIRRLAREPLTHFFAIGLAIFLIYGQLERDSSTRLGVIVVDDARVTALVEGFRRTWQRPPTQYEFRSLLDAWVREEVLYREGMTMRLDQDDPIVRRRIAQKMEFITDGLIMSTSDDAELEAWLNAHPDDYRVPARYSLQQVFFDPVRHGESLVGVMESARMALVNGERDGIGDSTLLPARLEDVAEFDIARTFGTDFATSIATQPGGQWGKPVVSGYGQHIVYIDDMVASRMPALEEIRSEVERDVMRARMEDANEAFYEALRQKYNVEITADVDAAVSDGGI
jgi:hypothetical protein